MRCMIKLSPYVELYTWQCLMNNRFTGGVSLCMPGDSEVLFTYNTYVCIWLFHNYS